MQKKGIFKMKKKSIPLIVLVIALFSISINNIQSQTWKELMDSTTSSILKNDFKKASQFAKEGMMIREKEVGQKDSVYLEFLSFLIDSKSESGQIQEAFELNEKALQIKKDLYGENSYEYSSQLVGKGSLLISMGQYDSSIAVLKKAIPVIKKTKGENNTVYCESLKILAGSYLYLGMYKDAIELLKNALALEKSLYGDNGLPISRTLNQMSITYHKAGLIDSAETCNFQSLEIIRKKLGENHPQYAISLNTYCEIRREGGKFDGLEDLYLKAIKIIKSTFGENHPIYIQDISNLAILYQDLGRYVEAEKYLNIVTEYYRIQPAGAPTDYALSLLNLGSLQTALGRFDEAEENLKKSIKVIDKSIGRNNDFYLGAMINLAEVFYYSWKNEEAIDSMKQALQIVDSVYKGLHPYYSNIHNNLAQNYTALMNYDQAEKHYQLALEYLNKNEAKSILKIIKTEINLGRLYSYYNKKDSAEKTMLSSLEKFNQKFSKNNVFYPDIIKTISIHYTNYNDFKKASEFWMISLNHLEKKITENLPFFSEKEQENFWSDNDGDFELFTNFAIDWSRENKAILKDLFETRLLTKALLLNESSKFKHRIQNCEDSNIINQYKNLILLKEKLMRYNNYSFQTLIKKGINLDSIEKSANEIEKGLSQQSEDFQFVFNKKRIDISNLQNSLNNDEAAIEIISFRRSKLKLKDFINYALLIVKKDSKYPELVLLKNGNELEGKYIELYRNLTNQQRKATFDRDKIEDGLKELYSQFWAPIQEKLKGIKTVYLSPDGIYNVLNLNTLINPETNKYLLDEIDLRVVTSTRDLIEKRDCNLRRNDKLEALLIGDPKFNLDSSKYIEIAQQYSSERQTSYYNMDTNLDSISRGGIAPLPGTKKEIDVIANDMEKQGWKVDKKLGAEALEEAIKSVNNPKVLHIATHGVFLKDVETKSDDRMMGFETQRFVDNPLLRSMLLFAGAENTIKSNGTNQINTDDGLLTAYEAQNLNLDNTELVVLSACETGLGEIKNGEGVYGLQRAFQVAGAKSLIMSLWSVSDRATEELMTSFYTKWLSGKSKREAFREAQSTLKSKYPGFYYWGAFVMVGE